MIKLLKNLKWYDFVLCFIVIGVTTFQVWLNMELITKMGEIIALIQTHSNGAALDGAILWDVGYKMILIALGICACAIFVTFLASQVSARFSKTLRSKIFEKVNSFSMEEMNKFSTASLITRSTTDVKQVEMTLFTMLRLAVTAPIMAAFAIVKIVGRIKNREKK